MVTLSRFDYNTRDGSCIHDYIDVVDLAKAHVLLNAWKWQVRLRERGKM